MDVLANVLSVTRLGNSVLSRSELLPPWGLEVGSNVRAAVHIVQRGVCWVRLGASKKFIRLNEGDIVLVPRGQRHTLSDDPRTPAEAYEPALAKMRIRLARAPIARPTVAVLLCAEYEFSEDAPHPLLAVLPEFIHLPSGSAAIDVELSAVCRLLLAESAGRPGSELVVPRLMDTLLVFIIRRWLDDQPVDGAGWFGALRDPQIGQALALIHDAPEYRWTVAELASRVAKSRAAFARRFLALVGESPLVYVTRCRLSLAAKLLRSTADSVEAIGAGVGYRSPTAFGNAFRRHFAQSPGQYRHCARTASSSSPGTSTYR